MNTTEYTHQFYSVCPNNNEVVPYTLHITVPSDRIIMAEHIVTACALHRQGYHEKIAADLFAHFGGLQVLTAHHHGVGIKTTRGAL